MIRPSLMESGPTVSLSKKNKEAVTIMSTADDRASPRVKLQLETWTNLLKLWSLIICPPVTHANASLDAASMMMIAARYHLPALSL